MCLRCILETSTQLLKQTEKKGLLFESQQKIEKSRISIQLTQGRKEAQMQRRINGKIKVKFEEVLLRWRLTDALSVNDMAILMKTMILSMWNKDLICLLLVRETSYVSSHVKSKGRQS